MIKKVTIGKEIVKVKGNYKVITIKKGDFYNFLKTVKLRVLDKEYDALMPPLGDMQKNTIDVNGLSVLMSQFMSLVINASGGTSSPATAQMVLTTQSGTVNLTYTGSVNINTQGVSAYFQIFNGNGNYTVQYYYVGYDTTDDSYTTSQIELLTSASVENSLSGYINTDVIRIAYANASFTKTSDSYLFIVWLIQFQNIPPYALLFIPTLQNNANIILASFGGNVDPPSSYKVYFNNGNCNFTCSGDCPSAGLTGYIVYAQDNNVIMEFPVMVGLSSGTPTAEMLICYNTSYYSNFSFAFNISGSFSTTLSPPVSGGTFYLALATITLVFQTS